MIILCVLFRKYSFVAKRPLVCLSVCVQDIWKSCVRIRMKLGGQVWCVTTTNWFNFGEDLNPNWYHLKLEGYSVERIPPPCNAWSMRTYRAQYIFEISCYIIVFGPISQWWRITLKIKKILIPRFGFSPKSNQFVVVRHPTCPPRFVRILPQLFEISCIY